MTSKEEKLIKSKVKNEKDLKNMLANIQYNFVYNLYILQYLIELVELDYVEVDDYLYKDLNFLTNATKFFVTEELGINYD